VSTRVISRARAAGRSGSRVERLGLGIIALGLVFRIWALAGSWFFFDDLAFLSAGTNDPLTWDFVGRVYAGHVMPAGWLVVKALATWAPYQWGVWAGFLVVLQALASWGMLRLLRSMFGDTQAVLPLLAGYVFYVFTVPAGIWFAAGINQLPFQVGLVFGLHAHLDYLRTRRTRSLVLTLVWTVASLAFYEKSLLLFGLYALFALCWFSSGRLGERVAQLWKTYRAGVIAYGTVAIVYLVIYAKVGLSIGSTQPDGTLLSAVAYRLIGRAFSTAAIGGPFSWISTSATSLADPSDLISLGSWVALGSLVWYAASTRTRSRRAWSLIVFTLVADVYLLASARANLVGPDIGLEYRYQTESAAVLVLAVGLAFLPLLGAVEVNEVREDVPRPYEQKLTIQALTVCVVIAALVSTLTYVRNWQQHNHTEAYFDNVAETADRIEDRPAPVVDGSLPQDLLWAFGYPENTYSHIFKTMDGKVTYPTHSLDRLYVIDGLGQLTPAVIPRTRFMVGGSGCGYVLKRRIPTAITLNGPVIGGGWWIQMTYGAPKPFKVTLGYGSESLPLELPAGDHTVYFQAGGRFSSVLVDNSPAGARACITSLSLGQPSAQLTP
jgi:hypothetical protein